MKFLMALILSSLASAAPYPVTGSSVFLDNKINAFLWPYGLDLNLQNTQFEMDLTRSDEEKWIVKSPYPGMQIYLRIKKLSAKDDFEKVLRTSIREYEKSGYRIVSQQLGSKAPEQGWIHLQDSSEKQLVQSFAYKDRTWAYLNCVGTKAQLQQLQSACDSLSKLIRIR